MEDRRVKVGRPSGQMRRMVQMSKIARRQENELGEVFVPKRAGETGETDARTEQARTAGESSSLQARIRDDEPIFPLYCKNKTITAIR